MNANNKSLNDVMKIYRIRKINQPAEKPENRNFEEFKRVYRDTFSKHYVSQSMSTTSEKYVDESKSTVSQKNVKETVSSQSQKKHPERKGGRPVKNIKTVKLEWPLLGTEGAICQTVYRNRLPIKRNVNSQTQAQVKQVPSLTEQLMEKWNRMKEVPTEEDVRKGKPSKATPSTEYNSTSMEQGDKSNLPKPPEKSRKRPQSPTYKPRGKNHRHHECINRRYMATLSSIKQKLQKLDEKYFGKPQIMYKSVRDIHTQPSTGAMVQPSRQNSGEVKIEEVFRGIKMDLDAIANPKLEERVYSSTNWSFNKPTTSGELNASQHVSYSTIIDQSEARMKRMRIVKQHIVDVEEFCDKLCNIGEEDDDEELQTPKAITERKPAFEREKGIFDDTELQRSVSRSAYLMKEFKIDPSLPTIKVFSDSGSFRRSTNQFFEAGESSTKKRDRSITSLLDHLNAALNNSIYKPV